MKKGPGNDPGPFVESRAAAGAARRYFRRIASDEAVWPPNV